MSVFIAITHCNAGHGFVLSLESVDRSIILTPIPKLCGIRRCAMSSTMWPLRAGEMGDIDEMLTVEFEREAREKSK